MARFKKLYKKYERHFLLGIVIILLASFSITGAFSCQDRGQGHSFNLGGTFNVAPGEREEISDEEFDRHFAKYANFQYAIRMASREFRMFLEGLEPPEERKAAWAHFLGLAAAQHAGYKAGDHQVRSAVEDMVGFALAYRARMRFDDITYNQFLRTNFPRGSRAEFEESVREVVLKDQFLYPLVTTARYQVPYAEAYEAWRGQRERVDLQYVALPATAFADAVRKDESTRASIGEQADVLAKVSGAAATIRRVRAKLDEHKKVNGAWPAKLADLGTPAQPFVVKEDPWGTALDYEVDGDEARVRSAGPDAALDTPDDVTIGTQEQIDTHGNLFELAEKIGQRRTATNAWPKILDELKGAAGDNQLPGLVRTIQDGWKRDFEYAAGADDAAPTLTSRGPDGELGTDDDIGITLDAKTVRVTPGKALAPFVRSDLKDSWDRPLLVRMARAQPPTWKVSSAGADGEEDTDDDLTSGNAPELKIFFNSVQGDYAVPARRRFETLFVHLPLVGDATLERLWDAYPQHRPTDEEKLYEYWRSYKGEQFFYRAEDPRDAEKGHGAELAKRIAPEAPATLVPAKDLFPASLDAKDPKDAPKKDDEPKDDEPKDDEPKDDEPKDDEAKDDEAKEDGAPAPDAADRKTFLEKGWREVVIRELFLENLFNDVLTRCRDSNLAVTQARKKLAAWEQERADYEQALAAWELANADKPEAERAPKPAEPKAEKPVVPAEVTFETVLDGELKDLVAPTDAKAVPAIQYWKTPELMSREAWEKNENFGDGLQFELSRLKEDGEYNGIPAQLHRRLTKVLVRRLEFVDREPQPYEEVKDKVFDRFLEQRQIDRAATELQKLQKDAQAAISALGSDADDAQKQKAWDDTRATWSARIGAHEDVDTTGLFIGSVPPPALDVAEDATPEEKARIERRNFVWRAGYATVRPVESTQDTVTADPGSFGRSVLRDPVKDEKGTGCAFLVRVAERVYPSKAEFSPRRYTEYLSGVVFGDRNNLGRQRKLSQHEGAIFKALAKYFEDLAWLQSTFDLQTNSDLNELEKRRNR